MTTITFDTLKFAHRLRQGGIPEPQADAITEAFIDASGEAGLATGHDIERLDTKLETQIAAVRTDIERLDTKLETQIAAVHTDIERLDTKLETRIAAVRTDIERLDTKLETRIAAVHTDIELAKRDLTIRLGAMIAAGVAILSAFKFFGH
ncbi:MAG: CCDC90 family protein [Alphaproteobacteria bacterium]